jgi:DNA repair exonuclease SbcCD ATPase subunit
MPNIENICSAYRKTGSLDAVSGPENLQQSLEEFGEKLRQLKERESYLPSREWLEDAERWLQRLKTSLEDYRRERAALQSRMVRAQQLANEAARRTARRTVRLNYESLQEYVTTAGQTLTKRFRNSRAGLRKAFNRALGRNQELEARPGSTNA